VPANSSSGFDSRDCVNLIVDALGDTTGRPLRPSLMKLAQAERERLARWQPEVNEARAPDKPERGPRAQK
jgi:hypothetical protein